MEEKLCESKMVKELKLSVDLILHVGGRSTRVGGIQLK